jgi:hypothetical protein
MGRQEDPDSVLAGVRIGGELALDLFHHWRRDLPCLDALILLAITKSNVDGMLHSRNCGPPSRDQSSAPPDRLRLAVSISIIATTLGLPEPLVHRRAKVLAAADECEPTPCGMVTILQRQVEATGRYEIVQRVYEALRLRYADLAALGVPFPSADIAPPAHRPVRSSSAFAARYALQLLSAVGRHAGGSANALLFLQILRSSGWGSRPAPIHEAALAVGLSPRTGARRVQVLVEKGICRREGRRVVAHASVDEPWLLPTAGRNRSYLSQLLAGLAEVGALADFGRIRPER